MRKKLLFFILFVLMITGIAVGIHDYFHWKVMLTTETFSGDVCDKRALDRTVFV